MTIGVLSAWLGQRQAHDMAADPSGVAAQARAHDSLERQGFVHVHRRSWSDGEVALWTNPGRSSEVHAVERPSGAACSVGPIWYRGAFGNEALHRLLDDAGARAGPELRIDETALRGNFALFLETAHGRWLLNDALGFVRLYCSGDARFYSTSWLAVRAYAGDGQLDEAAAVEYVLLGAAHSDRTPARGVTRLPLGHAVDLLARREQTRFPDGLVSAPGVRHASFDGALEAVGAQLEITFREIARAFPGRTSAALSGGFDSRLIVASLLAEGERPRLFVYGSDASDDVRIAREIADGEKIPLQCIDKAKMSAPLPECELEDLVQNALFFDGLPNDGIDDRGTDRVTRLEQNADGFIALNGGGGEIFRNFFHLPDRRYRSLDIVRAFYRGFDAGVLRRRGALSGYEDALARSIARCVGLPDDEIAPRRAMTREQVELVYPFFRCHHWMGLNNSLSVRYGAFGTPLVDLELVRRAVGVPLKWKNAGAFESALVAARHPGVARYRSSYGFRFADGPDSRARCSEWLTGLRPTGLRPTISAVRRKLQKDRVAPERIRKWRDRLPGEWRLDTLLDLDRLSADGAFERALSVEVVARELAP